MQLISLNYHPRYLQFGLNYCIGSNQPMDNLKVYQIFLEITTIFFYNKGETIKSFKLCFTKFYNQIPKIIRPHNKATLMHYYNTLTSTYDRRLEENNANNMGSTLQTCLEFEE
jgi:hypothetical protein